VCVIAVLQLLSFSWYPVADLIATPLVERARTMAAEAPRDGYAAILLLGGVGTPPPEGSTQHLELSNAAGRVWLAARLYHAGLASRIIVSGGSSPAADGTALMSEAESILPLLQDLGVPSDAILIESRSLNTHGNAQESRRLIGDQEKVALVTSALHVPRAMREMQAAGITAHPFPTQLRITADARAPFQRWLPNTDALALSTLAIKEWLGIFNIWITDVLSSNSKPR
jgi:uncharacterized SAM-binding protein YcdF (DUF218 family)